MKSILQVFSFNIVSKIIMGLTGILLIRYMSQEEYAGFTLAFSLITVVTQALAISLNRIYIVGNEKLNLSEAASSFLGFQLASIILLGAIAYPWLSDSGGLYWFVLAATIATCFLEFSKTIFQEKMKFISYSLIEISRAVLIVLGLLAGIYFLGTNLKAWQVISIQAAAMGFVFVFAIGKKINIRRLFSITPVLRIARDIIRGTLVYLFGYFFVFSFFGQIDVFMLCLLSNDITLATYGSALKYYTLVIMALGSANAVLLPMTQKAQTVAELKEIFRKYKKLIIIFTPVVLLGAWASQWIIPWIDNGRYPQAIIVFRILAISSIISFAFSPHANLVMKFERFRFLFILVSTALVMSILLNLLLVRHLGAVGTAISTLVSFAYINGAIYIKSRSILNSMPTRFDESVIAGGNEYHPITKERLEHVI